MNKEKPILPLDNIYDDINKAVTKWKNTYTAREIQEKVKRILDSNFKEIVLKLLGFDNKWGKWELETGTSFVKDYMKVEAQKAAVKWINTFDFKDIKIGLKAELTRKYKAECKFLIRNLMHEEVQKLASDTVKEIMEEVTKETEFDKRQTIHTLLTRDYENTP